MSSEQRPPEAGSSSEARRPNPNQRLQPLEGTSAQVRQAPGVFCEEATNGVDFQEPSHSSQASLAAAADATQSMVAGALSGLESAAASGDLQAVVRLLQQFTQEQRARDEELKRLKEGRAPEEETSALREQLRAQAEEIKALKEQQTRDDEAPKAEAGAPEEVLERPAEKDPFEDTVVENREEEEARPETPHRSCKRKRTMTEGRRYKWGQGTPFADDEENKNPVERELNDMKIATLYNMRTDIKYQAADAQWVCPFLYLTNLQANRITEKKMPKIREVMEVEGYKMVIRLFPSRYGPSNEMTFPYEKAKFPCRTLGEQEHILSEHLTLLAQKVILPLALKTGALVVCTDTCDLALAFLRVAAPVQRRLGEECPFKVLFFLRAPYFDLLANEEGTRIWNFKKQCSAWQEKADLMEEARMKVFGEDEVYHPHGELIPGDYSVIMFEALSYNNISDEVGNTFQNSFISSLADSHPVIGLQTLGTNKMNLMPTVADHVSRGLPLMLLDSHDRSKYRSAHVAVEMLDGKEDELMKRLKLCQEDLTKLAEEWKNKSMTDRHTTSMVAYVKSIVAQCQHIKRGAQDQKHLWIWEAIDEKRNEEASLSRKLEAETYPSSTAVDPDDPFRFATNMIMHQAGEMAAWEGKRLRDMSDNALKRILKEASDWTSFAAQLNDHQNWMQIRATCFFKHEELDNFAAKNKNWCRVEMLPIEGDAKHAWLVVDPEKAAKTKADFPKARKDFEELCLKEIKLVEDYDKRKNSVEAYMSNRDVWLAVYEILGNKNIHSANLYHLSGCEKKLLTLAQNIDRLPQENTLASLVLLRRAWTLVDLFEGNAKFYKFVSKASYFLGLVTGIAVITLTTIRTIYSDEAISDDQEQYALLGLALVMSAINGMTTVFEPSKKWMHLRGGNLALEKEIWKFRTRVGPYSMSSLSRVGAGREAELAFQNFIHGIHDKVLLSAGLKDTDFFSISTCTDDVHRYFEAEPKPPQASYKDAEQEEKTTSKNSNRQGAKLARSANQHVGQTKSWWVSWMNIYHRHHQYPDNSNVHLDRQVLHGEDNHHSPATSFDYIRFRIMREKQFYQTRIPKYAWRRRAFQLVALAMSLTAAFLAAMAWHRWTTILTIVGGSCAAWQEFTGLSKKLERYSTVASSLDSILMWWQTLPTVDQSIVHHVEELVERTESLLGTEHAAWLSDAQQIHRLNVAGQERQRTESKDQKANRETNRDLQTAMHVMPPNVPQHAPSTSASQVQPSVG